MLEQFKQIAKSNKKNIGIAMVLALLQMVLAYLLSSREYYGELKHFFLLALYNFVILYGICKSQKWRIGLSIVMICTNVLGFVMPVIGSFTEPIFLQWLMKEVVYFISLPSLILCLLAITKNKGRLSMLGKVLSTFICLLSLIFISNELIYYLFFGAILSPETAVSILSTDKNEAKEFIEAYFGYTNFTALIIFGGYVALALYKFIDKISLEDFIFPKKASIIFSLLTVFVSISYFSKTHFIRTYDKAFLLKNKADNFHKNSKLRISDINNKCDGNSHKQSAVRSFALVIGESHNRTRMHAYGHDRENTIFLDKGIEQGNTLLINNSYSCSALTAVAVPYALTERSQYNGMNFDKATNIVEMAKHAGYRVVWVSNQINSTMPNIIGLVKEADEVYNLNSSVDQANLKKLNTSIDSRVVDALKNDIKNHDKTLYIIHLLGSHSLYRYRYPDDFHKWQDKTDDGKNTINTYDNSVLYNDYIMENISDVLFNKFNVDALLYFSDHGEEVTKYFRHGDDFFLANYKKEKSIADIVKIPVYLKFSEKFKMEKSEILKTWQRNNNSYFTNDMIYDTMLGIMNIKCQRYNSAQDFTSETFNGDISNMRTMQGKVKLEDCK